MNNTIHNLLLLISVSLNICFLLFAISFILRKGGIFYIKSKISHLRNKSENKVWNINAYYKHKKSQFEILPKSNDSIVFLGDSLTDEGEWFELLGNPQIKNRGISGDTTARILNRLDTIINTKPKQIFLMVGINDFANEKKSIAELLKGYQEILRDLQTHTPNTQVFIQSVLPVNNDITLFWQNNDIIVKFNFKLQQLAKEFSYQYIDVYSHLVDSKNQLDAQYTTDGVHLNGKAYLIWKEVISKYVGEN
ncbi:MAG: G-D-S-L family lipolytic protein [Richelia sp. RM2_1_2]|nr:G-D-S-L family lipolytic protein [Richelia sp. SM1_7_0]NJN06998.1 G-D-S-L family lipolytic protein [Richelia sp. RM1_1_1]NJO30160.1 G-D-S-L family lipolytic protein [Richelia sp. SL_2_1]NJO62283.1 G-D-S-L family lipolytic protein [Richelia sp. RM2_1_2]